MKNCVGDRVPVCLNVSARVGLQLLAALRPNNLLDALKLAKHNQTLCGDVKQKS